MEAPLLAVMGSTLVLLTLGDVVMTTLGVGVGWGRIADTTARFVLVLMQAGRPGHRRRRMAGIVTTAMVPLVWVALVWVGFALVFLADHQAVVDAATQQPTTGLGRFAYAAGALAGAGAGLVASSPAWQLVNNVAALTGLALVTLSLTYLMQVVSAVVAERATMAQVSAIATVPVLAAVRSPSTLPLQVVLVADGLCTAAQRHLALPMLQHYHSTSPRTAASVNLLRYQQIVDRLDGDDDHAATVASGQSAIDMFLDTLHLADVDAPADRTTRLGAFLDQEGWSHADVASPEETAARP